MSKLINCKTCNTEFSKNAKMCPQCGEPNNISKGSFYRWSLIIIITIMLIPIFVEINMNNSTPKKNKENQSVNSCYEKDRLKTFNLFEKAFKKHGVSIKNLYWMSSQTKVYAGGYSNLLTFDGKEKRGTIWFDENCNPKSLKVSSGMGTVKMYYYDVLKNNSLKLTKTEKNTYN